MSKGQLTVVYTVTCAVCEGQETIHYPSTLIADVTGAAYKFRDWGWERIKNGWVCPMCMRETVPVNPSDMEDD